MIPEDETSDKMWKKEDIEMKLDKIIEMEKRIERFENELRIIQKRIIRLQDQKVDIK